MTHLGSKVSTIGIVGMILGIALTIPLLTGFGELLFVAGLGGVIGAVDANKTNERN